MHLYERVAGEIEAQIKQGILPPGDKLLSIRESSRTRRISVNTTVLAYVLLEKKGLIESRPQSGFYVASAPAPAPVRIDQEFSNRPRSVRISDIVDTVFSSIRDEAFSPLGAGCLSPELYPNAELALLTRKVLRSSRAATGAYSLPPGEFAYRQQISRWLARTGTNVPPGELLATSGATEAAALCLRSVARPGDTILVESPNYFGLLQCIEALNLRVIEVPADPRTGVDPDRIKRVLSRKKVAAAVLMPNFNNPLGSLMPDEHKKEVARLAQRFGVPVIEDDVYGDLPFSQERPKPIRAFDGSGLVMTCSSFSKTVTPGLRIGWAAPGKFFKRAVSLQLSSTLSAGTLAQKVLTEYLSTGSYDRHLRRLRTFFAIQVPKVSRSILDSFPEGTRVTHPQGGFLLWVELPKRVDSVELHYQALRRKISICPGVMFSANGKYRHYIRVNCGQIWDQNQETAVRTLGALARGLSRAS